MPRRYRRLRSSHQIRIAKGRCEPSFRSTGATIRSSACGFPIRTSASKRSCRRQKSKLVRADIRKKGDRIGYIPGAGDDVPESLQEIGYSVKILTESDITAKNLAQFSAVVLGIRAYNTQDRIANWLPELFAYVKAGGVVIAQYNTLAELKTEQLGPYPLEISRDRVTDENAEVRILAPNHPLMTTPNKITSKDFEGWVQERGLYFPKKWDPAWTRDPVVQRSKRKATRWRFAGCKGRQRFLYLHELFLVSTIACRSSGSLSVVREHVVIGKMNAGDDKARCAFLAQSVWPGAFPFAVEVVLLYLFTIRFS